MVKRSPSKKETDFQIPRVVFQPQTTMALQAGVNLLLNAIRPTLGPLPRQVAVQPAMPGKTPELLDSGGTIARRIIQIQDRDQDMGLMFARHMLWKLEQKVGDGTATAAVIFQDILNQGIRFISAGGNAIRLGTFLQEGLKLVLGELDHQVKPLSGQSQLRNLAESIGPDPELADHLGKIFETIGPYNRLEVRNGRSREFQHEFIQGIYWEGGPISQKMIQDKLGVRTVFHDAAVLATDLNLNEPAEVIEILETALSAGISQLLLVVSSLSDRALAPLLNPSNRARIKVIAVKIPGTGLDVQAANLIDLAMLTGGRPVVEAAQIRPEDIQVADFGYARQVWLHKETFGITSGKGEPAALRRHIKDLQNAYIEAEDVDDADKILKRLGHLLNGSATLWVGALSEDEYQRRKEIAQRTAHALRMALLGGVLPGGGVAFLTCLPVLEAQIRGVSDTNAIAAYRMLTQALQAPFRTLMENSGYESGQILADLGNISQGLGFNLRTGRIENMLQAGIVDPARVIKEAVHSAVSSAALLLTTDVLVHKRNPIEALHTA